jgi:hypothetical protein
MNGTTQLARDTASAFNKQTGWDIDAAESLAVEVLTDANAHAEVRLYQASPELLAALQIIAADGKRDGWIPLYHWSKALAAIARATGETVTEGGKL